MPPPTPVTLYLSPYLRLYLLTKLADRERAANDADARDLWRRLGEILGGRLVLVENDYAERRSQYGKVVLLMTLSDGVSLAPGRNGRVKRIEHAQAELQRRYLRDMYNQVDWFRAVLGTTARNGLELFRAQYGVTEEDHAFATAERLYQKYCQQNGLSRPRSRSAKRSIRMGRLARR